MYKYRVTVMESERGWGASYSHEDFDTPEQAADYIARINSFNVSPVPPDYYMQAESMVRVVEVPDEPVEEYIPKHRREDDTGGN